MDININIAKILIFKIKQNYFAIDLKYIVKATYQNPGTTENLLSLDSLPFFTDIIANHSIINDTTNIQTANKDQTAYVVIKNLETPIFITVDEIIEIISVNHYKLEAPSAYTDFKQYILAIYPYTKHYVSVININKLIKESLG